MLLLEMDTEGMLIVFAVGLALPLSLILLAHQLVRGAMARRGNNAVEDLPTRAEVEQIANAMRRAAGTRLRQNLDDDPHCGLCLDEYTSPVELLPCGHTYCNACILLLWSHTGRHRRICCPVCRSPAEYIFPAYALRDVVAQRGGGGDAAEGIRIDRQLHAYNTNAAFAARSSFRTLLLVLRRGITHASLLPVLIQLKIVAVILLLVVYIVSPVDVVPDVLGAIGLVDDAAVAVIMGVIAARILLSVLA